MALDMHPRHLWATVPQRAKRLRMPCSAAGDRCGTWTPSVTAYASLSGSSVKAAPGMGLPRSMCSTCGCIANVQPFWEFAHHWHECSYKEDTPSMTPDDTDHDAFITGIDLFESIGSSTIATKGTRLHDEVGFCRAERGRRRDGRNAPSVCLCQAPDQAPFAVCRLRFSFCSCCSTDQIHLISAKQHLKMLRQLPLLRRLHLLRDATCNAGGAVAKNVARC